MSALRCLHCGDGLEIAIAGPKRFASCWAGCGATGSTADTYEEAIAAWNRRVGDAEVEKLRAELAGLETALLAIPGHTELPAPVWETIVLIRERRAALGDTT